MFKRRRKTNPIGPTCTQAYSCRAVTHTVNQYTLTKHHYWQEPRDSAGRRGIAREVVRGAGPLVRRGAMTDTNH